jgi:hypothetical protein
MARKPGPKLSVIQAQPVPPSVPPPAHLDAVGAALWVEVCSVFEFADPGSYEVLAQACAARSRAARCAAQIDADGEMIRVGKTVRSHPLLRDEATFRALCCRCLARLGLDLAPTRDTVGRPPGGGVGLTFEQLRGLRD